MENALILKIIKKKEVILDIIQNVYKMKLHLIDNIESFLLAFSKKKKKKKILFIKKYEFYFYFFFLLNF